MHLLIILKKKVVIIFNPINFDTSYIFILEVGLLFVIYALLVQIFHNSSFV